MNRRELVLALAERTEVDRKTAETMVNTFVEIVTETVATGETVAIPGFAKFARVDRAARMGRNPATGETIKIKASRKARITPLKAFKEAVNTGKVAKKPAVKKAAPARKATAKKAPAKKAAPARKATAKKAPAKKAPGRKATTRKR